MTIKLFVSVLLILYILNVGNGYYYHWYTTERMKTKFLSMKRELIMEAIRNIQRVDHFKDYYTASTVYDIGQMLYFIRSKFARMVRVLILAMEIDKKFEHFHQHLPALMELHHLSMDIYNLVEMLEEYDAGADERSSNWQLFKAPKKSKKISQKLDESDVNMSSLLAANKSPDKDYPQKFRKSINVPSSAKRGFYSRKPNEAFRNRMKVNKPRDFGGGFDSEFE